MPDAANVDFNVRNFTPGVSTPASGIFYVMGLTKRGPIESPELKVSLINSWPQFKRLFGGLMETSDFPYLCKRAIVRGARLRVCRIDAASTPAVKATAKNIVNGDGVPVNLFSFVPKYKGVDYNNFTVEIKLASNGSADYWNMELVHANESELNEVYENLPSFLADTADTQTCLDEVKSMSRNFDFTYLDASDATLLVPVVAAASAFANGVDPTGHVAADYTGAMSEFDDVDDGLIMAVPEMDDDAVNAAGITYAAARKDIVFFAHLPNSITTAAALITERETIANDSKYGGIYGGGIRVREERTLIEKSMSEMGDVLGIAAYIHNAFGEWYSLAGQTKGYVPDAIGVVNNFGTPGRFADLNLLANAQINMMVQKNGIVQLSGNFSAQFANNQEKYLNVVMLVLWMKKTLKPILESYLEEPNDPIMFNKLYYHLKPYLDKLASPAYRAIYKYEYYGDQDASTIDDLQTNDPVDVQNGKYKINLKIWPIPSLQELTFNLMLVQGEGVYIE